MIRLKTPVGATALNGIPASDDTAAVRRNRHRGQFIRSAAGKGVDPLKAAVFVVFDYQGIKIAATGNARKVVVIGFGNTGSKNISAFIYRDAFNIAVHGSGQRAFP
ncbi:hypothetical protein SDC9_165186 [bioreactor metagenome]|uniref:Uncharacterized protein n=1 Tax=bioreactor metagenome TaxID=1076179 RepID=A0A645FTP1_9ZZZZ